MASGMQTVAFLAAYFLVASRAQDLITSKTYTLQLNSTGGRVCATEDPSVVIPMKTRATGGSVVMKCGSQCTSSSNCLLYQFKSDVAQCELYNYLPSNFTANEKCSAYGTPPCPPDALPPTPPTLPMLYEDLTLIINGLALLNDTLYATVAYEKSMRVYNATTLQLQREVALSGASNALMFVATSAVDNSVYIVDIGTALVYRVNAFSDSQIYWNVTSPKTISINQAGNLLVVSECSKLYEFSSTGTLLKTIYSTAPSIEPLCRLSHAIELSNESVAVANNLDNTITIVTYSGQTLKTLSGTAGCGITFPAPTWLVKNNDGYIIVMQHDGAKLVVLNPSLTKSRELLLPNSHHVGYPLMLDETRVRVYLAGFTVDWDTPLLVLGLIDIVSLFN